MVLTALVLVLTLLLEGGPVAVVGQVRFRSISRVGASCRYGQKEESILRNICRLIAEL